MSGIPDNPSESFKRRNPHLYPPNLRQNRSEMHQNDPGGIQTPPKRIRQSQKPLLNKLEQAYYEHLKAIYHPATTKIYPQTVTLRLCNGVRYTPDFVVITPVCVMCYEVKGGQPIQDDASVKIKMAAALFPIFEWFLVWRDRDKQWQLQKVLP